jgi:uncharacterized protein YjdB
VITPTNQGSTGVGHIDAVGALRLAKAMWWLLARIAGWDGKVAIPVTGITVTGAGGATTISTDNGTLQLSTVVSPSNASIKSVVWSVQNGTGQASVNNKGLVTAITNGSVTVIATAQDGSNISGSNSIMISNQDIQTTIDNNKIKPIIYQSSIFLIIRFDNCFYDRKINIYSLSGSLMYSKTINSEDFLDISSFPKGTYLLTFPDDMQILPAKFTVR